MEYFTKSRFILTARTCAYALLATAFLGQASCTQQPPASNKAAEAPAVEKPNTPVFQLSAAVPPAVPEKDWCRIKPSGNVLINAEKINTNRRYFFLPQGLSLLSVGYANLGAVLFLKPMPNGNVAVFTGANFPNCLSRPDNLSPAGGSAHLRYDNKGGIEFNMELQPDNGHSRVTIEYSPDARYGMSVIHCPDCQ